MSGWFVNDNTIEIPIDAPYGTTWQLFLLGRGGTCLFPSGVSSGFYNSSFSVSRVTC